jgi:hypothetical protein
MGKKKNVIYFRKIPVPIRNNKIPYFNVFYAFKNNRSVVKKSFDKLQKECKKNIKELIIRMATNYPPYFKSDLINWELEGNKFNYGEIRLHPHRFFFFRSENSLIFFGYISKKVNKLSCKIYKEFQGKKDEYEKRFREQFQ